MSSFKGTLVVGAMHALLTFIPCAIVARRRVGGRTTRCLPPAVPVRDRACAYRTRAHRLASGDARDVRPGGR